MDEEALRGILGTAGSIWFTVSLFLFMIAPNDMLSVLWMINMAIGVILFLLAGAWEKRSRGKTGS